jgi:hypothetical protein
MRRTILALLAVCFSAVTLAAQPTRSDLQRGITASPLERHDEGAALTKTFVAKQLLASAAGMVALGAAGGFIGARTSPGEGGGFQDIANALAGAVVGGVIGSAIGVHWYSKTHGHRSPFLASLAGAAVGTVGFAAGGTVLVTVPVGAVIGHNWARR